MHLAELNISRWKIDPASEEAKGFTGNVGRINALAERSPGFVWRLTDEQRTAEGSNAVCPDRLTEMTLSVWETVEDLEQFVWNTVHKRIYNGKNRWFSALDSHHLVMWHVEEGHQPSITEARERLDHLELHGNTDFAFEWSHLPGVKLWQIQQQPRQQTMQEEVV